MGHILASSCRTAVRPNPHDVPILLTDFQTWRHQRPWEGERSGRGRAHLYVLCFFLEVTYPHARPLAAVWRGVRCGAVTLPGDNPESEGEAWSPFQSCSPSAPQKVKNLWFYLLLRGLLSLELKQVNICTHKQQRAVPVTSHWGSAVAHNLPRKMREKLL